MCATEENPLSSALCAAIERVIRERAEQLGAD